jgi:hypothetical protein
VNVKAKSRYAVIAASPELYLPLLSIVKYCASELHEWAIESTVDFAKKSGGTGAHNVQRTSRGASLGCERQLTVARGFDMCDPIQRALKLRNSSWEAGLVLPVSNPIKDALGGAKVLV